jgi:hypothetical protein
MGRMDLKRAGYIEVRQNGMPVEVYDRASAGMHDTEFVLQPFISHRCPTLFVVVLFRPSPSFALVADGWGPAQCIGRHENGTISPQNMG